MKKFLSFIFLIFICLSCKKEKKNSIIKSEVKTSQKILPKKEDVFKEKKQQNLKEEIKKLGENCLDFNELSSEFEGADYSVLYTNRQEEKWIFNLEKEDSVQFSKAYNLVPKCKVFENDNILCVVFIDEYDYHRSLQLFTFKKPNLIPVSNFPFYLMGGDAEGFIEINLKEHSDLKYTVEDVFGYDKSFKREGELLIKKRDLIEYKINPISGKISKTLLKSEKDIKEFRESKDIH